MKSILIIEDEEIIRMELGELLRNNNYNPLFLTEFVNPLDSILKESPDLILMDINIPNINGKTLLSHLRKKSNVPVIMVTSLNNEIDEVLSMSYGADDYVTKPYNPEILLLRIQAVLKRLDKCLDNITIKGLSVNLNKGIISASNEEVVLTKNEMIIFSYLLNHKNKIVTRDELMTDLWNNNEYINDNALTVNISRLRSKLKSLGYDELIETRKGIGYIISCD